MCPNVDDLSKSNFISKRDVKKPMLVTIKGYEEVEFRMDNKPKWEWVLYFEECDKGLICKPTVGQIIRAIIGSNPMADDEFAEWIGKKIVLYYEPNVSYQGKLIGGVRVRAPRSQTVTAPKPTVRPTMEELRAAQKAALAAAPPPDSPEQEELNRLAAEITERDELDNAGNGGSGRRIQTEPDPPEPDEFDNAMEDEGP